MMTTELSQAQVNVLKSIKEAHPEIVPNCYIVGAWVWTEFKEKPHNAVINFLKGCGFRWNAQRGVWQNACGIKRRFSNRDPRDAYGVVRFTSEDN